MERYADCVSASLRAKVQDGRLILDEPVDLPDGTEVDLVLVESGEELDPEDLARLHRAIERAAAEQEHFDAAEVLAGLPSRQAR